MTIVMHLPPRGRLAPLSPTNADSCTPPTPAAGSAAAKSASTDAQAVCGCRPLAASCGPNSRCALRGARGGAAALQTRGYC